MKTHNEERRLFPALAGFGSAADDLSMVELGSRKLRSDLKLERRAEAGADQRQYAIWELVDV